MSLKIKKGDKVQILAGKDRGKTGLVERVLPKTNAVVVTGLNMVKKHMHTNTQRGIVALPAALPASRVMLVCPHCQKPTRIKAQIAADGTKTRVCRHCNEAVTSTSKEA